MKAPILIILYQEETNWMSCLKIHQGLLEAYKESFEADILYLNNSVSDYSLIESSVLSRSYQAIIGLDHRLSPTKILNYLVDNKKLTEQVRKMKIIFHPFGAIKELKQDWIYFNQLATSLDIHLALPSEAQKSIYENYLIQNNNLHSVPCLIGAALDKKILSHRRIPSTEGPLKIGYLGRISRLKNIIPMVQLLSPYLMSNQIQLHLAGPFDDYDKNDITRGVGFYMKDVMETIKPYPQIYYHGVKTNDEVYEYLASLDGFCTLSTNPGEDFCFSVAEALRIGLPCLLTKWIGLIDHAKRNPLAQLIETKLNSKNELDINSVSHEDIKVFLEYCRRPSPEAPKYSTIEVREELKKIIESPYSPFAGFHLERIQSL